MDKPNGMFIMNATPEFMQKLKEAYEMAGEEFPE